MNHTPATHGLIHSVSMDIKSAFLSFMSASEMWGCRAVALAHPAESFEMVDRTLPALWLSAPGRFPGFAERLMADVRGEQREMALFQASRVLSMTALSSIHVCMDFQSRCPERSALRRLHQESTLSKELEQLMGSACADGFAVAAARRGSLGGILQGVDDFRHLNPASAYWIGDLQWYDLVDRALAQAEAHILHSHIFSPEESRLLRTESVKRI